ncbi:hypothetical protein BG011_006852 [Mortierella polycephala]|uniref:Uncharacterized protein n=1 Tax=Mortierella polycephala TaxID=41804 RepID=A0A9P6PSJ1_9FUNG|nr:hypothetical protein BG011_006852 [Mortierella polycephala]
MAPFEIQQEVLPIQLPMQPMNISRRRASRTVPRSDVIAALNTSSDNSHANNGFTSTTVVENDSYTIPGSSGTRVGTEPVEAVYTSPLAWLSRVITKAGQDERLHYHPNGSHHHHHHNHNHSHQQHSRSLSQGHHPGQLSATAPLRKQLFSKATVVTLEKKYSTVHWAAEFYCTISSPFFALPVLLYLDPAFRWSAPEIHTTHFAIFLSVVTALTSTLYHATLYKIFSSLDACFATIMFYINTIQLLRSLPEPYAMMVPDVIASIVHWNLAPYVLSVAMMALFIFSWKRTAMLSLLLMVLMIPATIWGFVVHESWLGLGFGLLGLTMFAVDRFKVFCGHSYWHLAGGLSLWYGLASGALAK